MTGLLSRMNSLGPTGKAAAKLAQHMSRALSAPGSPIAGGGSSQLARFNSMLSAASATSSAAPSAATSPRAGAAASSRPLSRFASQVLPGGIRVGGAAVATHSGDTSGGRPAPDEASAGGSPTAAATAGDAAAGAGAELDAAAWARHYQQSQQVRMMLWGMPLVGWGGWRVKQQRGQPAPP